jgi:hypothetical protein
MLVVQDWSEPIGRMLIRRYNFFARTIMYQSFGDKHKLSPQAHEHYLRPLAAPEVHGIPKADHRSNSLAVPVMGQYFHVGWQAKEEALAELAEAVVPFLKETALA